MQKITTFLMFESGGAEAVPYYVSLFENSRLESIAVSEDGPNKGALLTASFVLDGHEFFAMDGGPHFSFAEGMSLFVNCETQEEIDDFWEKLSDGGEQQMCGWVKDRWGVFWQIVPSILGDLLQSADAEASQRAMDAMLQMRKLDIAALQRAYDGA
jgi:predicted 3-demethylubiquinone-9 3-methyltransferase (glyoxalase superfamily)